MDLLTLSNPLVLAACFRLAAGDWPNGLTLLVVALPWPKFRRFGDVQAL